MPNDSNQPDGFSLNEWRNSARSLRRQLGLDDSFSKGVQEAFKRALIKQYWQPLFEAVMDRTKQSERTWATIVGIDRTTAYRWRGDLSGDYERRSKEPTLHHFVKSLAAFDLDRSILPRGLAATLEAYRETYDFVEGQILEPTDKHPIATEEVLCLHLAIRSQTWCEACVTSETTLQQQAAADLVRRVSRFVSRPSVASFSAIQDILRKRFVPWALLETEILYEWIQS